MLNKFYTSYLANVRNIKGTLAPVFVATSWPGKPLFPQCRVLAPSSILPLWKKGKITEREYVELYNKQLASLDYEQVKQELLCLASGSIPVLICYETPEKFCHRHLIAQWIRDHGDFCTEYTTLSEWF